MVISSNLRNKTPEERRAFIEKKRSCDLSILTSKKLTEKNTKTNIENFIGSIEVPLGVAGPLNLNGEYTKGVFYLPLATTEGALVASIQRGCKAAKKITTTTFQDTQARSLLFLAPSARVAKQFIHWTSEHAETIAKIGEKTSLHLHIHFIKPYVVGRNIWLRISANTQDAMGMNMITIAAKAIAEFIIKHYPSVTFISESGNLCVDKKPSMLNLISGKGKYIIAECFLEEKTITSVLKTKGKALIDLNYRKNLLGSIASGTIGANAHAANMISAMFLATGQDMAHIANTSVITTVEKQNKGVLFSVTLPELSIGSIGGGTVLPHQKACLSMLGVAGGSESSEHAKMLGEIIAACVLVGELSLLSALTSHDLTHAHKRLNR